MSRILPPQEIRHHAIGLWLWVVAALIVVTLIVGGATRLTESGLSIVEWKPLTGVVPPMSDTAWHAEFDKYKTIPQFRERNSAMTLAEFKLIYWWEWSHRMLARLVGAAFLLPFLWFLWRGWVGPELRIRLWIIFGLGASLGAVGWWMVASGLTERVNVSQYRLAFHLTLASGIFAAIIWTAARLGPHAAVVAPGRIRLGARGLVVLILLQIYFGALVAGLRAGLIYNTWPTIDGSLVPDAARLFFQEPLWRNFFENALTVQFDHRMLAYLLLIVAIWHAIDVARTVDDISVWAGALGLVALLLIQIGLGIATVLYSVPIVLALAHQGVAIAALAVAVLHAANLTPRRSAARTAAALEQQPT
ncbi:MAG: COX15/CtaA family protein [Xanthobacteraceae bacterium]